MKYVLALIGTATLLLFHTITYACDVCQKQQPKILRGISHGAGPESDWDYVIVGATALIVLISLIYAVKWMIRPGEEETEHIKRSILEDGNA